ncbi:DUF6273 domain-containing protein [Collinsella aerofaciens]|uniref:DUF6273 domain-containing protein n=1 Tax=Collinsella aerofaciens TaxID=74426 RepID=UPI003D7B7FFC
MQRHFRLGGVAPKTIRLRGQSIIEYVLIIAIIGLVIVFAGPQVSGAIRNQFNQVSTTLASGTDGGFGGGVSGGSTGADSATVQAAVAKDAKDWTLDEQKAAATDIAKNGTSSVVYAKAKAAMDAGTKFSLKLTNGKTLEYRIIGIYHDDHADGSGSTGLTFEATNDALGAQRMDSVDNYFNSWGESELRARLNTGDLWALLPSELQSKVETVTKETNAKDSDEVNYPSEATDKVFLLSMTEIYGDLNSDEYPEGYQYEYFQSKGVTTSSYSGASSSHGHWTRSARRENTSYFYYVSSNGSYGSDGNVGYPNPVFPAWCF